MKVVLQPSKTTVANIQKDTIERERLTGLLQQGDALKLTLVRAPVGYDNTTMPIHWVQCLDLSVVYEKNRREITSASCLVSKRMGEIPEHLNNNKTQPVAL